MVTCACQGIFLDALCEWVTIMPQLDSSFPLRFHIVAHSLYAYPAVAYALRQPHRVINLVLTSPDGVPRAPPIKLPGRLSWLNRTLLILMYVSVATVCTVNDVIDALCASC